MLRPGDLVIHAKRPEDYGAGIVLRVKETGGRPDIIMHQITVLFPGGKQLDFMTGALKRIGVRHETG